MKLKDGWHLIFRTPEGTFIDGELQYPHLSPEAREVLDILSGADLAIDFNSATKSGGVWVKWVNGTITNTSPIQGFANMRIFNRALSEDEVKQLYKQDRQIMGLK